MAGKRTHEPFQADEGSGMDAPYDARRTQDKRALVNTEAGPKKNDMAVPADDTAMKNPDGDYADPASAGSVERKQER